MKTKLKVIDRINSRANKGRKNIYLPLYRGQVEKLKRDGFKVIILHKISSPKGEFMCSVAWDSAKPGTFAFIYFIIAEAKYSSYKDFFADKHIFIR